MGLRRFSTSHTQKYINEQGKHGGEEGSNEAALPGWHHSTATVSPHQGGVTESSAAGKRTLAKWQRQMSKESRQKRLFSAHKSAVWRSVWQTTLPSYLCSSDLLDRTAVQYCQLNARQELQQPHCWRLKEKMQLPRSSVKPRAASPATPPNRFTIHTPGFPAFNLQVQDKILHWIHWAQHCNRLWRLTLVRKTVLARGSCCHQLNLKTIPKMSSKKRETCRLHTWS